MSAFAEFERRTLIQRTKEGLAAARRRGQRLGRPPKLDAQQLAAARKAMADGTGVTLTALARQYDVAPWTLSRSLRRDDKARQRIAAGAVIAQ